MMHNMYVACIYDPRSLTLVQICMMHISVILDPNKYLYDACIYDATIYMILDPCVYDADMNGAYIHDP